MTTSELTASAVANRKLSELTIDLSLNTEKIRQQIDVIKQGLEYIENGLAEIDRKYEQESQEENDDDD